MNSLALGLGEIEVNSFLNQPLNAEIEVISARPGEIDDLLVSLATREAFERAGLERPLHLSELKFAVRKSEDGDKATIVVTTRSAMKEPFLSFLIEADWSKGRVLREFTVLLDPPFYADQPAAAETVSQAVEQPVSETASVSEIVEQSGVTSTVETGAPAGSSGTITEPIAMSEDASAQPAPVPEPETSYVSNETKNITQGDVSVSKGDTLWSIAARFKDKDHSMAQVMLAFQRANPGAFNNGNINNMKVGAVLRAPGADEIDALGKQDAYAEVLIQNGLWDEYVARVTGVSPAVASEETATEAGSASSETPAGELSLLLPGSGESESTGIGDTGDVSELRTRLALAEEELDASRIENVELESRIAELQARLTKIEELQKMVEIEDDSLAQLTQQSDEVSQPEAGADAALPDSTELAPADDVVADTIQADEKALLEELLAEEAKAQAEEQAASAGSASEDQMVEDQTPAADVTEQPVADGMVSEEAASSETSVPLPAPVILTQPVSRDPSIFDGILPPDIVDMIPSMPSMDNIFGDPIILGAIGGVILLLVILVVLKRRKGSSGDDSSIVTGSDEDLFAEEEDELTPIHLADGGEPEETDIKMPSEEDFEREEVSDEPKVDLAATAIISRAEMPEPEAPQAPAVAEQDDVLNEVDVYLAYGLYDNAEELLSSSLTENPERIDYRSKLLDTYFATKNAASFIKEAEKLKSMGDASSGYWDRVQIMGYELAPSNPLFSDAKDSGLSAADLEITKPQEADFDLGASEDDDTNFSTTDFNLGEEDTGGNFTDTASMGEAGLIAATQQIPQLDDLPDFELDDDDTDLRSESEPEAVAEVELDADLELPDDIGEELEFSMDEDDSGDTDEAELSDDLAMDFDIDDDAVELDAAAFGATEVIPSIASKDDDDEDEIDLGMEDTAMIDIDETSLATGELNLDTAEVNLPGIEDDLDDDNEDISIIDFGGEDFVEPTDIIESIADEDDSIMMDVDIDEGDETKTGTFAPGDFEEPTAAVDSLSDIDDIGDLMLPDDVDEVSTKLDLARAFIDMGDTEGARGSLEEVLSEGNDEQKAEAKTLLDQI